MNEVGFTARYPDDFADRESDFIDRGYCSVILVECAGQLYEPVFYDSGRLSQEVGDALSSTSQLFAEENLVVIAKVDRAHIDKALDTLSTRNFVDLTAKRI